ncbi:DUF5302 domain-containing protein [Thermopolyspora sp. NPDC052614]|uniref:DUF5302 domain-containing protein n=1 Tax=Thermopolyspora sp. NPDC052614 TaxID=3155682 RepID=UPI0034405346
MADATAEPEVPDDATTQHDQVEAAESPEDALKRKFREALERKRRGQAEAAGAGGGKNGSKIRGTHGPASGRRSFRRKSG